MSRSPAHTMAPVQPPVCEAADSKDRSALDTETSTDPYPEASVSSRQALPQPVPPVHRSLVCTEPRTARPSPPAFRCCTTETVHQSCRRAASSPEPRQSPAPRTTPMNCPDPPPQPP